MYGYLVFMILPLYAALDRMDPALIEAGKDLYGGPWETFRNVTWPHTFQGVLAGTVLVFLPAVGDFVAAQLLGGPNTYMVGNLIQQQFFGGGELALRRGAHHGDDGLPVRSGWSSTCARPARDAEEAHESRRHRLSASRSSAAQDVPQPRQRPSTVRASCALSPALFFVCLFAPIVLVALFSFNSTSRSSGSRASASCGTSASSRTSRCASRSSRASQIALVTMVVATVLGTMLAFGLVRARTRWTGSANVLMLVPLVTPEIVAAVSALLLFTQVGMQLSLTTIILGHITFSISYVTVVVRARLAALDPEVEEAAHGPRRDALGDVEAGHAARALAGDPRGRAARLRALASTTS